MSELTPAQKAYGLLWLEPAKSRFVCAARRELRDSLASHERIAGVVWASEAFPPVANDEAVSGK